MPANKLIFRDAEKARDAILDSQKKEIENLYKQWSNEVGELAQYYSHKEAPSYVVAERQAKELMNQINATGKEVANEIYKGTKKSIYTVADAVVQQNAKWLSSLGFQSGTLDVAFNYVPDEVVRNLVTGQIYDSGWSLSQRIWSDNEDTMRQAYQIVAGGMAQNKPIYQIAKDLEQYVQPGAKKQWNLVAPDGKKIYPKQVDYCSQRLARTLVQHGYQQSFVATTQKNPFISDYIWVSNGSRVCDLCNERNGKHFSKNDLPLDHPNGMCTMVPDVVEDLAGQLADWFNSEDGTYPDIDEFANNFGLSKAEDSFAEQVLQKELSPHYRKYTSYKEFSDAQRNFSGKPSDYIEDVFRGDAQIDWGKYSDKVPQIENTIAELQKKYPMQCSVQREYESTAKKLIVADYDASHASRYLPNGTSDRRWLEGDAVGQVFRNDDVALIAFDREAMYQSLEEVINERFSAISNGTILESVCGASPQSVAMHEWGHVTSDHFASAMIYDDETAHEYLDWYKSLSKDEIRQGISDYATVNRGEFEAECFTEIQMPNPRQIALKFKDFLDKLIEKGY